MEDHLSPQRFAEVWSRVAPGGSGGIVPRAVPTAQRPAEECQSVSRLRLCLFFAGQMEREDLLRRGLRMLPSSGRLPQTVQRRILTLSDAMKTAAGRRYQPQHLFPQGWLRPLLPDLTELSREIEKEYRHAARSADGQTAALLLRLAEEHVSLRQQLEQRFR